MCVVHVDEFILFMGDYCACVEFIDNAISKGVFAAQEMEIQHISNDNFN
jgi:predicted nucleic acid-binding Zn finger protein